MISYLMSGFFLSILSSRRGRKTPPHPPAARGRSGRRTPRHSGPRADGDRRTTALWPDQEEDYRRERDIGQVPEPNEVRHRQCEGAAPPVGGASLTAAGAATVRGCAQCIVGGAGKGVATPAPASATVSPRRGRAQALIR